MNKSKLNSIHLEFCDNYNYPRDIKDHFRDILRTIESILGPDKVMSVILFGSTARGELSYHYWKENLDILSDYEFFIIGKRINSIGKQRLDEAIQKIQEEISRRNHLFYIDFDIKSPLKVRLQSPIISTFETKKNGITIYGDNMIYLLPDVTLRRLDFGDVNRTILVRLWMFLMCIPKNVVLGTPDDYERVIFKYIVCRSAIDILTTLLPNEGVLLPTYRDRQQFLENNYKRMRSRRFMGPNFVKFQRLCYEGKMKVKVQQLDEIDIYEKTITGFVNLIRYLVHLKKGVGTSNLPIYNKVSLKNGLQAQCQEILTDLFHLDYRFNGRLIKEYLHKLRIVRHVSERRNIIKILRWWTQPFKKLAICSLLNLHYALILKMKNDMNCNQYLSRARQYSDALNIEELSASRNPNFTEGWLDARRTVVNSIASLIAGNNSIQKYARIMDWEHAK